MVLIAGVNAAGARVIDAAASTTLVTLAMPKNKLGRAAGPYEGYIHA